MARIAIIVETRGHHHEFDVVEVKPDWWQWGRVEVVNPIFRFVDIPDLTEAELADLVMVDRDALGDIVMVRARHLDLHAAPALKAKILAHQVTRLTRAEATQLLAIRRNKPRPLYVKSILDLPR